MMPSDNATRIADLEHNLAVALESAEAAWGACAEMEQRARRAEMA